MEHVCFEDNSAKINKRIFISKNSLIIPCFSNSTVINLIKSSSKYSTNISKQRYLLKSNKSLSNSHSSKNDSLTFSSCLSKKTFKKSSNIFK